MTDSYIKLRRQKLIIICLFLIVATLIAYWETMNNGFIDYDDQIYITENPQVQAGITLAGIVWAFTNTETGYLHPLTWLSYMFDYEMYKLNPLGYHWTNLEFHIANSVLLFIIFNWMTGALWRSAFVAALFALHPLHVESVAWIAERKDVLSTFFGILCLGAYYSYVRRSTKIRYLILILFFILGLMSKPMLVTLPFVFILLDFWPLGRFQAPANKKQHSFFRITLSLVVEKMPLIVISAIVSFMTIHMQQLSVGPLLSLETFPLKIRIYNSLVSYINYIVKMLWPQNLAVFYPYPATFDIETAVLSGLILLGGSVLTILASRKFPYVTIGWLWYLVTLIPVIGLIPAGAHSMADRYTYIPLIGLFIVLAWGFSDISRRWRYRKIILSTLASIVLVSLITCTWFQVRFWRNSKTLFSHAINVTHNNWLAHKALGLVYKKEGNLDKAAFHFIEELKICPQDAETHVSLGNIFALKGQIKNAICHFYEALRINPKSTGAHNDLGNALARQGKAEEAIYHYYEALRINPEYIPAYLNLGKVFTNLGKTQKAICNYRKALSLDPYAKIALYNLSWIFATSVNKKIRNSEEAVKLAEKLCELTDYNQPLALDALAAAYAQAGRFDRAVPTAQKGLRLALKDGPEELIVGIKKRLKLYRTGQPYRQILRHKNES